MADYRTWHLVMIGTQRACAHSLSTCVKTLKESSCHWVLCRRKELFFKCIITIRVPYLWPIPLHPPSRQIMPPLTTIFPRIIKRKCANPVWVESVDLDSRLGLKVLRNFSSMTCGGCFLGANPSPTPRRNIGRDYAHRVAIWRHFLSKVTLWIVKS